MNERIKELEKQSYITTETRQISGAWDNDRPPYRYVTTTETKFSPEKFAELIVKECLTQLEEVTTGDYVGDEWDHGYDAGLLQARIVLKEHFGVKE